MTHNSSGFKVDVSLLCAVIVERLCYSGKKRHVSDMYLLVCRVSGMRNDDVQSQRTRSKYSIFKYTDVLLRCAHMKTHIHSDRHFEMSVLVFLFHLHKLQLKLKSKLLEGQEGAAVSDALAFSI